MDLKPVNENLFETDNVRVERIGNSDKWEVYKATENPDFPHHKEITKERGDTPHEIKWEVVATNLTFDAAKRVASNS